MEYGLGAGFKTSRCDHNPDGCGTGFITHAAHDLRGVTTAFHVVQDALSKDQTITIVTPQKSVILGKGCKEVLVVRRDPEKDNNDSVLLLFKDSEIPKPHVALVDAGKMIVVGVEVGWLGFPQIAEGRLCFFLVELALPSPKTDGISSMARLFTVRAGDPHFILKGTALRFWV